jgi:hypothetical protein
VRAAAESQQSPIQNKKWENTEYIVRECCPQEPDNSLDCSEPYQPRQWVEEHHGKASKAYSIWVDFGSSANC